jgi:outer membrane protein
MPRTTNAGTARVRAREETGRWAVVWAAALVLLALAATSLVGQEVRELTLQEAIRIAKRNNPAFLSRANDQEPADWQVREAYGQLLPTANAAGSMSYTEAGVQRFGTVDLGTQSTDWYSSGYQLSLGWTLNGNTLFGVSSARAGARATAAGVRAAEFDLESQVTLQYMTALRARDAADVANDQFERAQQNLEIVRSRVESGFAAGTEGRQAEVDLGRAEVTLLQADRLYRAEKLRLQEQLGMVLEGETGQAELDLVSTFDIFEPEWTRDELLAEALGTHPSLRAMRAQESSSDAQVRQARSAYFPTVRLNTALQGFTNQALNDGFVVNQVKGSLAGQMASCEQLNAISAGLTTPLPGYPRDCGAYQFTPSDSTSALRQNDAFPLDFTKNPMTVSLSVSIPVFSGFSRQRQVVEAVAFSKDAEHARRAEELRLRTAVTQALDNLQSGYRQVEIETRNRELADQQLTQARQRYSVGNTSILELMDAQTSLSTAERDYLNAVYSFHQALVALEAATGRPLRPGAGGGDDGENGAGG